MSRPFKRLPEWEAFDHIEFTVVTRFKQSGMSGDCWRTSVVVKPFFKGFRVLDEEGRPKEFHFHDMKTALLMFGAQWIHEHEPIPEHVISLEERHCFQPGCKNRPTIGYQLKREFSSRGDMLDKSEQEGLAPSTRMFCADHAERGDGSREDCMDNYTKTKVDVPE